MSKQLSIYKIYEVCKDFNELAAKLDERALEEDELTDLVSVEDKMQSLFTSLVTITDEEQRMTDLLDRQIKELTERKKRITNRIQYAKDTLHNAMRVCDITKIKLPMITISRSKTPDKVVIDDETALLCEHPEYFIKQNPKIDKAKLKQDLKCGVAVDGAHLEQGETIVMRK